MANDITQGFDWVKEHKLAALVIGVGGVIGAYWFLHRSSSSASASTSASAIPGPTGGNPINVSVLWPSSGSTPAQPSSASSNPTAAPPTTIPSGSPTTSPGQFWNTPVGPQWPVSTLPNPIPAPILGGRYPAKVSSATYLKRAAAEQKAGNTLAQRTDIHRGWIAAGRPKGNPAYKMPPIVRGAVFSGSARTPGRVA